jgi:hypothetical protein
MPRPYDAHGPITARAAISVLEASRSALHFVGHQVGPDELDHAGVVVAVGKIVIERGEAVLLASPLHADQLIGIEFVAVDVAPVEG